jgi:hypothetical protein
MAYSSKRTDLISATVRFQCATDLDAIETRRPSMQPELRYHAVERLDAPQREHTYTSR